VERKPQQEIAQIETAPEEVTPIVPEDSKQKPWVIIGLISLVMLLLGLSGYLVYHNYHLKKQIAQTQIIIAKIAPTPSPISTSEETQNDFEKTFHEASKENPNTGWLIFEDSRAKLYFEYPPNLEVEFKTRNKEHFSHLLSLSITDSNNSSLLSIDNPKEDYWQKYLSFDIEVYASKGKRITDFVTRPICDVKNEQSFGVRGEPIDYGQCLSEIEDQFQPYKIGVIEGLKIDINPYEQAFTHIVFSNNKNRVYLISAVGPEGALQGDDAKKVTEEILSTFKLLD
jgi:hypothetical protein